MALPRPIIWSKSLTPTALTNTVTVQEQAFTTAAGDIPEYNEDPSAQFGTTAGTYGLNLRTGDMILVQPPSQSATTIAPLYAYVSTGGALGTAVIKVAWLNATAATNTPASGTYTFMLYR